MPPKKTATSAKRKALEQTNGSSTKRQKEGNGSVPESEVSGIVDRRFYPPEMANARCKRYIGNEIKRPIELLKDALEATEEDREKIDVGNAVVHWFKCDLRICDNKALHLASEKAKSKGASLICIYIVSPEDFEAHVTSPVRVDFILRSLEVLKKDLAALDIPLYVETVTKRKTIPSRVFELCSSWNVSHVFCNAEYEVDELRREAHMVQIGLEKNISLSVVPDTCVVAPGELHSGTGSQYAVYTPWFRAWTAYLHKHPQHLNLYDPPTKNPPSARDQYTELFDARIPEAPENKTLSVEEKKRFQSMWPAGEHEAKQRLHKFLQEKVRHYKDQRNFPAVSATAVLSVHFASGTMSTRTAVAAARDANSTQKLDGGSAGIIGWISEVAWRDFYKHVLAHWPFVCMNKPFKPEYTNIEWEYSQDHLEAWQEGRTGYPIVDAAMRQLNHTGYMHNRCRMIVASFLAKDLLLDWRLGERYFMSKLIDGDFASNNGGWGFSSSTGVDPQPYFRIFNPLLQSEKFDAEGEYIRKWVPELKELDKKTIHDPWGRGGEKAAKKNGYPKRIVDHKSCRERALARYKTGLGRDTT